jgi:hypothetical protein
MSFLQEYKWGKYGFWCGFFRKRDIRREGENREGIPPVSGEIP